MAIVNVPTGSYIIPMDTTYQNLGMWTAYGLVYRLLQNGIPVQWAIQSGKAWMGTDFTASATDFQSGTPVLNHTYKGGPFIIDAAFAAAAAPIITAWQSTYPNTKVHTVTAPFSADVPVTLFNPPRISIEDTNSSIIRNYLNAAGIPDSNGTLPWPSTSPDILNETEQIGGALFGYDLSACHRRAYDIFISPHTGSGDWDNVIAQTNLRNFLRLGGHLHAMCYSITAIENQMHFLTTTDIIKTNQGEDGTFTVDDPDHPLDQAAATSVVNKLPGGSEQTWQRSLQNYLPTTKTMAHFLDKSGNQEDFMIAGPVDGGAGAGFVSYEGGHQYATTLPYLTNFEAPYLRFFYNAIFLAEGLPEIDVIVTPTEVPVGVATPVTVDVMNVGGQDATNVNLTITLDASVVPASVVWTVPPTMGAFPTYTWTGLTAPANSSVILGTMTVTPVGPGPITLADFTATYQDAELNPLTMDSCTTLQAQAGPIPVVDKQPDPWNTTPNQNVVWTINTGNTAAITAPDTTTLTNPVLTDVIPAGLTFVNAVPAPTTNVLNPDGTRTLTWLLPNIPPTTPLGAGPVVTITVLTPAATTATYTNTVTLAGTDPGLVNQFSATDTALLNEVNSAPTVTITSPVPPGPLSGTTTVCWNGSDPDLDPVFYDAFYSPDGGTTWVQFGYNVSGANPVCIPFNTTGLNGDNFLLRVVATDTELTGQDEEGPFLIDNTPPTVELIAPPDGSTICGLTTLEANATDSGTGVAQVLFEYSLDGGTTWVGIGTDTVGPPWDIAFETSSVPDGPIQIRATATDNVGLTATSNVMNYIVDNTPPTAAILSPATGSTVSGTVTVVGSASDNIALNRVEWRIDGVLQATQTVPPFDFIWDTTQFIDGPHTFTLTAFDNCGNTAVATATYLVDNVPDHAAQVGVDGNITIPPLKPDVEQIVESIVQIEVTKAMVIRSPLGGKVIVMGVVHILITYVADEPTQGVHAVEVDIPWQTFVMWPELPAETPVKVIILMESADFKLLDPRTISKFIVFLVGVEQA